MIFKVAFDKEREEREREIDENKLHEETSISFYTKHIPSISFSRCSHMYKYLQQTKYVCSTIHCFEVLSYKFS